MAKYCHWFTIMLSTLFIVYFALATSSFSSKQQVMCHEDELSALVKFKQSFSINVSASSNSYAYPKLASWKLNGSDCCSWDGVECSADTGHVIGLDLGSSFIYGPLNSSSSLFHLVHLQSLNLSDNDFRHSQIPSAIALLSKLRRLDLSESVFSGQIPKEISNLTHLASLYLSGNQLLKLQNPSFKRLVQNLTGLEELSLSQVNISSHIPNILTTFTSLRLITLRDCSLYGEFPKGIFHLPKLQFLSVRFNQNLRGYLPEFHKSSRLKDMRLAGTSFSGKLPVTMGNLKSLNILDLENCSFTVTFPASLNNLTKLTTLNLGYNLFTDRIPTLANLTQLTHLNLRSNHIGGHIPSWLMNLTQLTSIDLGRNQLEGTIPASFSQLKSLTFLALNNNNLSGTVTEDIFHSLRKLFALQLGRNRITFTAKNNSTNVTLPRLEILELQSCNLKVFPDFLRNQNELVVLFMDQNLIEGQVPQWFWNSSKDTLEHLSLWGNLLTGFEHHPHVLPWVGVNLLNFGNNMFQGPLPVPPPNTNVYLFQNNGLTGDISPLICQASSLHVLDLSYNNLTGRIPSCLGKLSNSLSMLMLKGNNFSGTIPDMFMEGSKLKMIELSENQLVGKLPRSLTNCTMLQSLDLADNNLEDIFPSWLGILLDLRVLILHSNKFHGAIKSSQGSNYVQFPKLHIIDLSDNAFAGGLPREYIQSWTSMKNSDSNAEYLKVEDTIASHFLWLSDYDFSMTITNKGVKREYEKILNLFTVIDLSSNKFIGEITESIGQLQGLQLLNLSNNFLTGYIPLSFQNLTNLECLDLSQNRLSGRMPQQLAHLSFLAFLNVSYNHLQGPIPQGEQFNTFQNNSYEGNPGLCGEPLSKKCGKLQVPLLVEVSDDSEFPSGVDWVVISLGLGSGLVVGLIFGNYLTTRHHDWFVKKFGKRQDKWVRPIRKERRN